MVACAPVTLMVVLEKEEVVEEVLVVLSVAGAAAFVLVPIVIAFIGSCFRLWRYFRNRAVRASLLKRHTTWQFSSKLLWTFSSYPCEDEYRFVACGPVTLLVVSEEEVVVVVTVVLVVAAGAADIAPVVNVAPLLGSCFTFMRCFCNRAFKASLPKKHTWNMEVHILQASYWKLHRHTYARTRL